MNTVIKKAEVETAIKKISKGNYLVIRLSKIFSLKKDDGTLLDEMAKILISGKELQAATDQIFCPTLISDLVEIVTILQTRRVTGVINVCSQEI